MKLFVILFCLFCERYLIHSISYKRFWWFSDYYNKIKLIAEKHNIFLNPWVLLTLIIIPILLIVTLIYLLLYPIVFGLMGLILSIGIFYYCLGPHNAFYPITQSENQINLELIGNYFTQVNRQLFSLIFWYIIAGPIGALTYRLITLCCEINAVTYQANEITDLLEWIPSRMTAFLFLLVGNFQRGYTLFNKYIFAKPDVNNLMVRECGLLAVRKSEQDDFSMIEAETLVEHAIIVLLVVIALFTLLSWL